MKSNMTCTGLIGILGVATSLLGATVPTADVPPTLTMKLWPGDPPHFVEDAGPARIDERGSAENVSVPGMAVYLPPAEQANGQALIVCPGGSYREVGYFTSGMGVVDAFLPDGTAVIVLKYRTRPPSKHVIRDALADARRAVQLVRHHAAKWNIDPHRIGMVGTSAGSHLILNAATHPLPADPDATDPVKRYGSRPDFVGLMCTWPHNQPVSDFPVTADAPPAFIASARDDTVAPTAFSRAVAAAYRDADAPVKLWLIDRGGHRAFTLDGHGEGAHWPERFKAWVDHLDLDQK